jgi:hypothetical protein
MLNTHVLLSHYGLIVDKEAINSMQFIVRSEQKTEIARELDLTGIYYTSQETVNVMLRIFLSGELAKLTFEAAGIEVHTMKQLIEIQNPAEEVEGEEESDEAVKGRTFYTYYVEYPLSSSKLEDRRLPLIAHPRFVKLSAKEDTLEKFNDKIANYLSNVENLNRQADFSADDLDEEDEGNGNLGAPRLSTSSVNAQAEAHRADQLEYRERALKQLDWFQRNICAPKSSPDGVSTIDMSFNEALTAYADINIAEDTPLLSNESLLEDLKAELITID